MQLALIVAMLLCCGLGTSAIDFQKQNTLDEMLATVVGPDGELPAMLTTKELEDDLTSLETDLDFQGLSPQFEAGTVGSFENLPDPVKMFKEVISPGVQRAAHSLSQVKDVQNVPSDIQHLIEAVYEHSVSKLHLPRPMKMKMKMTGIEHSTDVKEDHLIKRDTSDQVEILDNNAQSLSSRQSQTIHKREVYSQMDDTDTAINNQISVQYKQMRITRQSGGFDFGELPNRPEIQSVLEYAGDALQMYYNLVRSFVDGVLPGPLPYEIITPQLASLAEGFTQGNSNDMDMMTVGSGSGAGNVIISKRQAPAAGFDFSSVQPILIEFVTYLVPALVVFGIGIVIAVLFPLTGCCFCCWRCCGKCGAKNYLYKSKHELAKCAVLSVIFLLANIFLLIGIILGFLSNDKISSAIKGYTGTVHNAVTDSINYVNSTVNEVAFLADDGLNSVFDAVTSDIQNAGTVLGDPLETSLQNEIGPFMGSTDTLLNNLDSVHQELTEVNSTLNQVIALSIQLNDSFVQLQEAMSNITALCMGNVTCMSAVPQIPAMDVALQFDTAGIDGALSALQTLDINGTRALINGSTSFLSNISGLIDDQLSDFDLPLNISQLDAVTTVISTLQDTIGQELGSNGTVGQISNGIDEAGMFIDLGEQYRYIAFVVLFVAIFLIWMVFTVGMLCGVFGYSRKALPLERSAVSNCGAKLLFAAIAICFLTSGSLLILSSLTYLMSSTLQKICNDLAPSEYTILQRLADDPQVWGGNTLVGSVLQSQAGINASISITDVLRNCEQNEPLYSALQVDDFFDVDSLLSTVTNLTDQIDLGSTDFGSSFNYTSADFVPDSINTDLQGIETDITNNFNFSTIDQFLNASSANAVDVQEIYDNLTALATVFQMIGNIAAENETLSIRDNLLGVTINNTVTAIQQEFDTIQNHINSLESSTLMISPQVTQVFDDLDNFLNNTGDIVNTQVNAYVDQLIGYFTGYINFTLDSVRNELGRCQPLTAAYGAIHNNVCIQTIDGVNGFWFSIGWCVLFIVPMVISAAILTTYLRKSKNDVHSFIEDGKDEGDVITNHLAAVTNNYGNQQVGGPSLNTPASGW